MGLRPRPHWGAYSAPPGPKLDLREPTSKGKERGKERQKKKRDTGGER